MKCFYCKKEIDESQHYDVTIPDGDCFHRDCLAKHEKEKERFFNSIIYDDKKFANWLGVSEKMIKKDEHKKHF